MADKLFTDVLKPINEHRLSKRLQADLKMLRQRFGEGWSVYDSVDDNSIFVAFRVPVSLPMRPNPAIPILEKEPVFILIDKHRYPYVAPSTYSNRMDFPADKLPHLNPIAVGPASFCLHRGNINDWYVEHGLVEYAQRVQSWLNDAAGDKLMRQDDEFEFTRVTSQLGYVIFDEEEVLGILDNIYTRNDQADFAISAVEFSVERGHDDQKKWLHAITQTALFAKDGDFEQKIEARKELNGLLEKLEKPLRHSFGLFVYPAEHNIREEYFGKIPNTINEFLLWAASLGLPVSEGVDFLIKQGLLLYDFVPISIVIRRPQKVINHKSNIEVLNFVLAIKDKLSGKVGVLDSDARIALIDHRNAMTFSYAREISGLAGDMWPQKPVTLVGCGALGSKLGLHLIRSGQNNIKFVDSDYLSPHNLVRNGLLQDGIGQNKASELKRIGDEIYSVEKERGYESYTESIINLLEDKKIKGLSNALIIDATASASVFSYMTSYELAREAKYVRCELVDDGKEGLLFMEGIRRNPRADDLKMALFDLAMDDEKLSKWLQRNAKEQTILGSAKEEIMVGMGCNSDTVRISDDLVSFHASTMASRLRAACIKNDANGRICCSSYDSQNEASPFTTSLLEFGAVDVVSINNASTWEVRFRGGIKEQLFQLLVADKPNETGGLLLGRIDYLQKTIYVTRIMDAPTDSKKTPYLFQRGKKGVPEYIRRVGSKTGNIISYVGEWHTHPQGGSKLSGTDMQAVKELREELDKINYPTFVTIVTPNKLHPYVFNVEI